MDVWIRLGGCPGEVSACGGIKRLLVQGTHPPRRPPRDTDRYIKGERRTGTNCIGIDMCVTPSGETCTAESSKLKGDSWGTLPMVLSHSIQVNAYVDSLVGGLQIANRDFHRRCGSCRYGGRPWNRIGWPPVCWRVRGRWVVNVGGRIIIQTPGDALLPKPRGITRH
jgi:hypothetical protein